ncbi:MAG TPA: hypothetical protein VGS22_30165 [Thermoanaerobaculia bacterium]|nr:hypothetical protein [Thermoanaerobaculia bacterium]
MADESSVEVDRPVEQALSLVERAAEEWGAEHRLEAGRAHVALPVRAGLRQGVVEAEISAEKTASGTRLTLHEIRSHWQIQISAVIVLLVSAAGGIVAFLWPFFPADLVPLAPFGAVLALSGWFLVISRLRTSRSTDFLRTIELLAQKGSSSPE